MSLGKIVGIGSLIGASLVNNVNADPIQNWQIDSSKSNKITVHVKKGDSLGEIARDLDKRFGRYDDLNDLRENLEWFTKNGYIIETDCGNPLKNPNLIQAGESYSFIGPALKAVDPDYGKQDITSIKNKPKITEKDIQVKTESKIYKRGERSLMSDISRVREYTNKEDNKTGKFVLSGEIGYSIFGEDIGEGLAIGLNAGYQLPGLIFSVGGRITQIPKEEYYNYRRSFFGFLYEAELDEEYLTATELYAQLMFGSNKFKIGGGYGVKNIGNIEAGASYGYWEGEGGINRDYDKYTGGFGVLKLMFPIDKNLSAGISARYGEYKTKGGLKLNETSVSASLEARF